MSTKTHWENVYQTRLSKELGWYKPHLQISLTWIEQLGLAPDASIIDIGGGASTLVDDLLDAGYRSLTVLDISEQAVSLVKERLGRKADLVTWLNGDITAVALPARSYDLWHDRAVFHFLTETDAQQRYLDRLRDALKPGGHLIIGTFAPEAPPRCSGLPVQRYDRDELVARLGAEFELQHHDKEMHLTPGGVEQMYLYCHFRRVGTTET